MPQVIIAVIANDALVARAFLRDTIDATVKDHTCKYCSIWAMSSLEWVFRVQVLLLPL